MAKDKKTGKDVSRAVREEARRQAQRTDLPAEKVAYWRRIARRLGIRV